MNMNHDKAEPSWLNQAANRTTQLMAHPLLLINLIHPLGLIQLRPTIGFSSLSQPLYHTSGTWKRKCLSLLCKKKSVALPF